MHRVPNEFTVALSSALAALGAQKFQTKTVMPSKSGKRKGGGSKRVNSSGPGGMNPVNQSDLRLKPPNAFNVPKSIPRNIGRMVTWDVYKTQFNITSGSSGLSETNYSFQANNNPQSSTWFSLFDQYCIPMVSIEFDSLTPPGQTYSSPVLYTALDFDNVSNISTIAAIEEYDSCEVIVLAPEKRTIRSVRPCTKGAILNGGGSTVIGQVQGPVWLDSGQAGIAHFGIRSMVNFSNAGAVQVIQTMYVAYRNHI